MPWDTKKVFGLIGFFNLPEKIQPDYDDKAVCMHGDEYSPHDEQLIMMSPNLTVYTETSDRIFPIPTYGRPTVGQCKCVHQADTHNFLLWNMGSGKLIDYLFIHSHLLVVDRYVFNRLFKTDNDMQNTDTDTYTDCWAIPIPIL